ncbi:hypothetical protein DFH06DRAFT_1141636 [Mycena polygramma]|nr:hypothetical protein DFH06DRAFT_1141636 [Mycena polygramma]
MARTIRYRGFLRRGLKEGLRCRIEAEGWMNQPANLTGLFFLQLTCGLSSCNLRGGWNDLILASQKKEALRETIGPAPNRTGNPLADHPLPGFLAGSIEVEFERQSRTETMRRGYDLWEVDSDRCFESRREKSGTHCSATQHKARKQGSSGWKKCSGWADQGNLMSNDGELAAEKWTKKSCTAQSRIKCIHDLIIAHTKEEKAWKLSGKSPGSEDEDPVASTSPSLDPVVFDSYTKSIKYNSTQSCAAQPLRYNNIKEALFSLSKRAAKRWFARLETKKEARQSLHEGFVFPGQHGETLENEQGQWIRLEGKEEGETVRDSAEKGQ